MSAAQLQQLTGLDAMFLSQEEPGMPMHIGMLMLYRPPRGNKARVRFKDILATFREHAHDAPIFHNVVEKVPL